MEKKMEFRNIQDIIDTEAAQTLVNLNWGRQPGVKSQVDVRSSNHEWILETMYIKILSAVAAAQGELAKVRLIERASVTEDKD